MCGTGMSSVGVKILWGFFEGGGGLENGEPGEKPTEQIQEQTKL